MHYTEDSYASNPDKLVYYSHRLQLMQIEREEIVSYTSQQDRFFNTARQAYEFNHSTRYYFKLPGCKYDPIKRLQLDDGTFVYKDFDI